MRVHGLKSPGNDESTARRRVDVRVPPCTVGHALHRRRSGKVAYGAHARSCPGLADCDGDRPGRRHRSTGTRQRISTWCGENARIQVRLRNRPLNAAAVVDGYWLAGLPSDQMRTHHLVRRFANLNEGRRHGHTGDQWITRQELAERYGLPVKTPAQWASKGTGPRYATFGRHVRYRLSDVVDWEAQQFADGNCTFA